jgi:uncharacterized phage-associated protein
MPRAQRCSQRPKNWRTSCTKTDCAPVELSSFGVSGLDQGVAVYKGVQKSPLRAGLMEMKCYIGCMEPKNAMLIAHGRDKTINAVIFFARNVRHLGKTKLFKLLYFLDFGHFRETGRPVTGMDYHAWKMGPVPVVLADEVEAPEADMCSKISFQEVVTGFGRPMLKIVPLADFDPTHFTKRELRLMEQLSEEYRDTRADDMIEATHLENLPWYKVYVDEGRKREKIPYEYALLQQEKEIMLPVIAERTALVEYLQSATA